MCSLHDSEATNYFNGTSEDVWYVTMLSHFIPEVVFTILTSLLPSVEYQPLIFSMIGSTLIGLSGVFPLLVIPIEEGANLKNGGGAHMLKVLLSFAVGCLLGDVFLHLLPEVWENQEPDADSILPPGMTKGLWILTGLLIFVFLEKVFGSIPAVELQSEEGVVTTVAATKTDQYKLNGCVPNHNNNLKETASSEKMNGTIMANGHSVHEDTQAVDKVIPIHVSGYLNLMANSFDNFTHGLAVGGSFLVSSPHGVLTTFAILLHEIPHEVGDFAILLKSGFSRWDAAKAQVCTAVTGVLGALFAITLSGASNSADARTSWIMPFTAGGFLHIALVTVLPDLLKEENLKESVIQMLALLLGICIMGSLSFIAD